MLAEAETGASSRRGRRGGVRGARRRGRARRVRACICHRLRQRRHRDTRTHAHTTSTKMNKEANLVQLLQPPPSVQAARPGGGVLPHDNLGIRQRHVGARHEECADRCLTGIARSAHARPHSACAMLELLTCCWCVAAERIIPLRQWMTTTSPRRCRRSQMAPKSSWWRAWCGLSTNNSKRCTRPVRRRRCVLGAMCDGACCARNGTRGTARSKSARCPLPRTRPSPAA